MADRASGPGGYGGPAGEGAPADGARPVSLTALADSRPDRYLIRDATLSMEVRDVRQASRQLVSAVEAASGYLSDAHESVDGLGRRSMSIKARVPFTRFDRSLRQIEALGKVLDRQITAEDVTEEFVDSQAKLRNLKRTELRLLEHLNRTARLADIVLVEKELNRVRGEIERLEGRLRFLEHRIAFSTITITLNEAPRPESVTPVETFSSGQVASDATRALVGFARVVWSAVIWIGIWAAVWAPLGLLFWLAYRRRQGAAAG